MYLSSGNDDVLASVLDAHGPIGVHDSQVTTMEVPTFEGFLGSLPICEILQGRKNVNN